jgi:hypothetical protein
MIRIVVSTDYKRSVIFAPDALPLGAETTEASLISSSDMVETLTFWAEYVKSTEKKLDIAGIGLSYWSGSKAIIDALKEVATRRCTVRIMTMHEDNPAIVAFFNPEVARAPDTRNVLEDARNRFSQKLSGLDCVEMRGIKNGSIHQQIILNEKRGMAIPYLYSAETDQGPLIICRSDFGLYKTLSQEFDAVWDLNSPNR